MKYILVVSVLISCLCYVSSCTDTTTRPIYNTSDFWNAHHTQEWDSASISNQLLGSWDWAYNYCCPEGTDQSSTHTKNRNITIVFSANTVEVFESNILVQTSNWSTVVTDFTLYGIQMDNPISQLYGRILFKEDKVLFNDSYRDGADNYFIKTASLAQ